MMLSKVSKEKAKLAVDNYRKLKPKAKELFTEIYKAKEEKVLSRFFGIIFKQSHWLDLNRDSFDVMKRESPELLRVQRISRRYRKNVRILN